ncbi:protocadherin Fat 4-like [Branchiostoma floridae]|uniref:Protocadherin Fat 4-like n=1 Tax=Branchiostoma floridae TaxID=7739 RepID=A0A9J7HNT7_BRAFL|nr:protocadherin Fat 4-like [Branchiostoma floridae]
MDNGHPSRTDSVRLTIEVTDVNDNAPIFDRDDYNSSTHRGLPTTEVLVTVSANDRDSGVNAQIMYSITGQYGIKPIRATIGETLFNINSSTGEIGVTTHFLYDDTQQYELIVTATDMGEPPLSNTTTVVIDVANTNFFAPEFLNTPVYRTMDEDTGTVWNSRPREVAKIKATDNDTEAEGQVIFLLPSNDNISDLFRVTTTKEVSDVNQDIFVGRIVTNAPLDREAHISGLNLTVLAVDQGATPKTSTALIHITLNDVNDNPPTLIVPTELVPIPQSSQVGTPVFKVQVDDPDIVNEFSFETIPSNHEYFSIIETTGLIFTIKDFPEQREHTLFIIVNDGSGKTDYGAISIFVGNPNLHAPVFSQLLYRTTVQQDLQVGTNLTDLNIFACDMDCPDSCNVSLSANCTTNEGRLTYGIATGNARDIFVIDPHTGLISTKWPLESLSLIPNYILVVIATDQSENSRTGSATVWVDVVHLGTTSVAPTAFPSDTKKLETDLDNHRYALFGVSGFAGLLLMITLGLLVKLVSANRRVKQMSTAHLTTPAFTAPQYDYVPGMTDYAYAEGTGTDDESPAPPPVANRPPLTLNNEERRAQATDRSHNVAMEMRSRMRPELQRQNRLEVRTADDRSRNSIYREQKYDYLQLNTRDTSNTASPTAETAEADKYGYLKPANQARQNNQRGQPNNPYQNDKMNRRSQVYTKDIPAPDYDVLPTETRI